MAYEHAAEDQVVVALSDPLGASGGARRPRADTSRDDVVLRDPRDRRDAKLEAHRRGRFHAAISVPIRHSAGRLMLHRRAPAKYHSGGLRTNTCCSHLRPGESGAAAATRRLGEEMGYQAPLAPPFAMRYRARVGELIEHELVHLFGGVFDGDAEPDPAEAGDWRWPEYAALRRDFAVRPAAYTVWFGTFPRRHADDIARFVAA